MTDASSAGTQRLRITRARSWILPSSSGGVNSTLGGPQRFALDTDLLARADGLEGLYEQAVRRDVEHEAALPMILDDDFAGDPLLRTGLESTVAVTSAIGSVSPISSMSAIGAALVVASTAARVDRTRPTALGELIHQSYREVLGKSSPILPESLARADHLILRRLPAT